MVNGEIVTKPETVYFTGRRSRKGETCLDELRASPTYAPHQLMALVRDNPIKAEEHAGKVQEMRKAGNAGCTGIDPKRLERWIEVGKKLLPAAVHCSTNNRLVVTSEDVGIVCACWSSSAMVIVANWGFFALGSFPGRPGHVLSLGEKDLSWRIASLEPFHQQPLALIILAVV